VSFLNIKYAHACVFSKIKAMGDEVGDSGKLRHCWVLFAEAKLLWMWNVILMNERVQSVGYNSF
jgi:hypothetical protein